VILEKGFAYRLAIAGLIGGLGTKLHGATHWKPKWRPWVSSPASISVARSATETFQWICSLMIAPSLVRAVTAANASPLPRNPIKRGLGGLIGGELLKGDVDHPSTKANPASVRGGVRCFNNLFSYPVTFAEDFRLRFATQWTGACVRRAQVGLDPERTRAFLLLRRSGHVPPCSHGADAVGACGFPQSTEERRPSRPFGGLSRCSRQRISQPKKLGDVSR
jgi:hypothetical protein